MSERYGTQVDIPIEGKNAYVFNKNYRKPLGYILEWKFASGTALEADTEIPDPENPTSKVKVVAVLDGNIYWLGGPVDPVQISGRLSEKNKATLNQCINSLDGGAEQTIKLVVTNYDGAGKAYYKAFHNEKELHVVVTQGTKVWVSPTACDIVTEPRNFPFTASITAKGDAGPQEWVCAENIGKKAVKPFGGIGAAG